MPLEIVSLQSWYKIPSLKAGDESEPDEDDTTAGGGRERKKERQNTFWTELLPVSKLDTGNI